MTRIRRFALLAACGLLLLVVVVLVRPGSAPAPAAAAPSVGTPRSVTVVAGHRNVVSWMPVTGAASYRVERASMRTGRYTITAVTTAARAADAPRARGIYWYRVVAIDGDGTEGRPSVPTSSDHVELRQRVGVRGGTIEPTTGTIALTIPARAVREPTVFTIEQLASPPSTDRRVLVARAFDIGPTGTRFRPAATLTLGYDLPADGSPVTRVPADATVGARFWDDRSHSWTPIRRSHVDTDASTVTARIPHLSEWTAATVTIPHGGYSADTDLCETCHASHQPPGEYLLIDPVERQLCYSCHSADGGASDVQTEFGEAEGSAAPAFAHPVAAPRDGVQLTCSDCHSPHRSTAEDAGLMRTPSGLLDEDGNPTWIYSPPDAPIGDAFCYGCHGATSTLPGRFGDHSSFETSAHDVAATMPRATVEQGRVQCLVCHEAHVSQNQGMTIRPGAELCADCHGEPADHGSVECASCHNPHLSQPLADPANTAAAWPGDISSFCLMCHASPTVTQPITAGLHAPYTIETSGSGSFSAAGWSSGPHAAAGVVCTDCHDPHRDTYPSMLVGSTDAVCLSCHRDDVGTTPEPTPTPTPTDPPTPTDSPSPTDPPSPADEPSPDPTATPSPTTSPAPPPHPETSSCTSCHDPH